MWQKNILLKECHSKYAFRQKKPEKFFHAQVDVENCHETGPQGDYFFLFFMSCKLLKGKLQIFTIKR